MNEVADKDGVTGADKAKLWTAIAVVVAGIASFYLLKGGPSEGWRWPAFAGSLVLAGLIFALSGYGRDLWKFFLEARVELYKVFWPTREETGSMTLVVFVFVVVMSLFFWGVDSLLGWGTRALLGGGAGG